MAIHRKRVERTLAIFPNTFGFGFVVFEGPLRLVDWGAKDLNDLSHANVVRKITALFEWFEPDICVVENAAGVGPKKSDRVSKLIRSIVRLAKDEGVVAHSYSRAQIRQAFEAVEAVNKQEIAEAIGRDFQELGPRVPKRKKLWQNEDPSMGMFDAASLALTHYHFQHLDMMQR